jgi:membrane-associated phospholipid phosphatase
MQLKPTWPAWMNSVWATPSDAPVAGPRGQAVWPAWAVRLLAIVGAIDLLWLALTPLSLDLASFAAAGKALIFATAAQLLVRRMALPARLAMLLQGLSFILFAWPVLRLFNHLVMTTAFPLADPMLASWDQALGLDWLQYILWADRHPDLLFWMSKTYTGLDAYSCATFVLLVAGCSVERAREFVLLFLLTAVGASTVGMFFPAEAAMAFYAPDPALFQHLGPRTGAYHLQAMEALRTDPAHVFSFHALPGLVTFPSFHTAMGLICIWCARQSPLLFVPMLLLNAVMIASTPIFGSHYFVDLIGGALLTGAAILLLRQLERLPSVKR